MTKNLCVKSYHTFIFPFVYKKHCNKTSKADKINSILDAGEFVNTYIDDKCWKKEFGEDNYDTYQISQYFLNNAKNIISNSSNDLLIGSYKRKFDGEDVSEIKAEYVITKTLQSKSGEEYNIYKYKLILTGINLKIFNNSVGILTINTEYLNDNKFVNGKNIAFEMDDFNNINDYGRRILMPYIPKNKENNAFFYVNGLTADKLEIVINDISYPEFTENFKEDIINASKNKEYYNSKKIAKPILSLIFKKELLDENYNVKNIEISPIIDDRMFVCSLLRDDKLSEQLAKQKYGSKEKLIEDKQLSEELYKIGYTERECSCMSQSMRKSILSRTLYDRWIQYGTIDIITHNSFIRITNEEDSINESVVRPFVLLYTLMAEVAFLQRATVITLINEINAISGKLNNGKLSNENYKKIMLIQEKYVKSQNQIFLGDVTAQEQGIEEFQILLGELYIDRTIKELDEQVKDVYVLAQDYVESRTNNILNLFAIFGTAIAFVGVFQDYLYGNKIEISKIFPGITTFKVITFLLVSIVLFALVKMTCKTRKK